MTEVPAPEELAEQPREVRPRAVLVGAPGAGKSTIGRVIAARLGLTFRDTDADIVELAGKPVAQIFVDDGEAAFRALEIEAVATALHECDGVLSLGGGAILAEATRKLLADHHVIYLDVTLATAARRVGLNRDRPLLIGNPRATLKALLDERRPLYLEVASVVIAADGQIPEVVGKVLAAVKERQRHRPSPADLAGGQP
jgi:shikimate kinase